MNTTLPTSPAEQYRRLVLIRRFEETIEDLFQKGDIKGTAHAGIGQEAIPVGTASVLRPGDLVTSTHRGHGHFLALGADPKRLMAELFGKATGYSGGRGGSQLMADFDLGFLGANGITGGSLPLATGAALSARNRQSGQVVVCFFGDGACNQGTFHESLNMAAIWKLPVIFLCENNLYAMSTHVQCAMAVPRIADRAAAYGMPGETIDGNDVEAVQACVATARTRAEKGQGPTLIEANTYRLSGHSRGDPRLYRTREEEATWRARDPIQHFRTVAATAGTLSEEAADAIDGDVEATVTACVDFSRQSPYPDPAGLEEGVWA